MIYLDMAGRIGNQMFRYAFAKRIQKENNDNLIIDFSRVYKRGLKEDGWDNSLKLFNITDYEENVNKKYSFWKNSELDQKLLYFIYKLGNQILKFNKKILNKYQLNFQPILNKHNLYFLELGYYKYDFSYLNKNKFIYICGSFESRKYFDKIRMNILDAFDLSFYNISKKNINMYNEIINHNSVCISIRRGDFVTNKKNSKIYNICDINYYVKAINIIKRKIKNPIFIMFSDDIDWVKQNIKFNYQDIVIYENKGNSLLEKMKLMSSCKNFIISNSTFSWWVQYLSKEKNKIVISPNKWYKNGIKSYLIEDEWIKIEV